ncbi:hypothetical protein [Red seabream iridovirus]|uniref:Uncharacterized protein n=1 Tax=Pompano iridovirus TaxID=2494350 RepID=A0A3Q9EG71_ISKNV|nr:hypothetical protein [Pompano iridovirus]AZQ20983.1 hypothetical protein [Pompano iridovirus]AZQ21022.1 hypothetical protein [Pompano iridovirus]UVC57208.1 hypothetical protein [Red seabream iridovirus]WDW25966.1 hypothetical protein FD201807_033L [Megalocytivirus FD201807]
MQSFEFATSSHIHSNGRLTMAHRCNSKHKVLSGKYYATEHYKFKYGNGCFSSLLAHGRVACDIHRILCIGCETGIYERVLCAQLFGVYDPILTDINPKARSVKQLSCTQALAQHIDVDAVMFCLPYFLATGYDISQYRGKYIIYVGEMDVTGHSNPDTLLQDIYTAFDEEHRIAMARVRPVSCYEHLCVFRRRV